jgi:hypothetical protein
VRVRRERWKKYALASHQIRFWAAAQARTLERMSEVWTRRDRVASALIGICATALLVGVAVSFNTPAQALFYLGGALGLLPLVLSPQVLFRTVTVSHAREHRAALSGGARLCSLLSALCFLLAIVVWWRGA